jgi:hypothetical protein
MNLIFPAFWPAAVARLCHIHAAEYIQSTALILPADSVQSTPSGPRIPRIVTSTGGEPVPLPIFDAGGG